MAGEPSGSASSSSTQTSEPPPPDMGTLREAVAALYTSPMLVLETLKRLQAAMADASQSLTSHFIRQWIHDTDCMRIFYPHL